jgi:hypothetical protein
MARHYLDKVQVDIVYILGSELLLDPVGTLRPSAKDPVPPRAVGFYLALRPGSARAGDYSASRFVGPLVNSVVAEKLKVSALALGARAGSPAPALAVEPAPRAESGLPPLMPESGKIVAPCDKTVWQ